MTVAELIAKLQNLPQDYRVEFNIESIGEVVTVDEDILVYDKSRKGFSEKFDTPSVILFGMEGQ